jgi:phosphopantetheinyl transferase
LSIEAISADQFDVEIIGYFKARVTVADRYPASDLSPAAALQAPRNTEVSAEDLYREGWMFHGPAYQGVVAFDAIGNNGIDGTLRVPAGKGALLDNMGQLAGYWVMEQPSDCLAMPIGVDRIRFFADDPQIGDLTKAQIRIRQIDELNCVSDQQLVNASGKLCIAIDGWRTRRYQMDKAFWIASRKLSHLQASQIVPPNVALFDDHYDTAILRDYISRRYLSASERRIYEGLAPRRRRQWLAGRVAAKDAVRAWLHLQHGAEAVWPQEICIENDEAGAPKLRANVSNVVPGTLHISIAHKNIKGSTLAVAIVDEQPVGIDIEVIEQRSGDFLDLTFSKREMAMFSENDAAAEYTRGWVAKEVVAKLQGTGLQGRLHDFNISARDGDCFCVNGYWVVTHALRDCILGWSLAPPAAAKSAHSI